MLHINDLSKEIIKNLIEDDMQSFIANNQIYQSLIKYRLSTINLISSMKLVIDAYGIKGLYYVENYLSKSEIDMIMGNIKNSIKFEHIYNAKSRRVAHYGYYYSYNRSGLNPAPPIPNYLADLVCPNRISEIFDQDQSQSQPQPTTIFDQLIINEYHPNQQIAPHIDHVKQFGPIIACISIGQDVPITFSNGQSTDININIKSGSIYIMTGDARYKYKHSLKNTGNSTRYSLTYRTAIK